MSFVVVYLALAALQDTTSVFILMKTERNVSLSHHHRFEAAARGHKIFAGGKLQTILSQLKHDIIKQASCLAGGRHLWRALGNEEGVFFFILSPQ